MKNRIKQYLLAASMCVGLTACSDFFEPIPGVQFGLDETFASKQRTEEYLNNVYSYVREVTDAIHPNTYGGIFTEASLDGANRWNKTYAEWTNGSFNSASAQASEYFSKYYQAIAKASTFIQNVDKCTEAAASTRGKWKSEARALRAYYYFELLRLYGPIPLIGEDPIPLDASLEELIKERNSVDECVNFIATELQSAIDSGDLLQRAGKANLGRMDVATCMALKAKLYLYWASPLFNGNTDQASVKNKDGKQLFPQTEDNSKWAQARDAYERFMTFATGQGYKLTEVYTNGKLDPYASCRAAGEFFTSPVLRLADMYLGYAEALCMCSDLDNALTYLNKIRVRAGIPEYTFTATAGKITCPKTQTDLLNRIRRERLVELVFEWNRYFDVRRWKVAEGQNDPEHWIYPAYHTGGEGGKVYGMNMDKDYPAFFERTSFETRVAFTKKQYFMPIPYDDLRRIPLLVQNLGW